MSKPERAGFRGNIEAHGSQTISQSAWSTAANSPEYPGFKFLKKIAIFDVCYISCELAAQDSSVSTLDHGTLFLKTYLCDADVLVGACCDNKYHMKSNVEKEMRMEVYNLILRYEKLQCPKGIYIPLVKSLWEGDCYFF